MPLLQQPSFSSDFTSDSSPAVIPAKAVPPALALAITDDKTFFFEAIQRLCSSLKPETAIGQFYEYISRFLPLASFSLISASPKHIHPDLAMCVAHANAHGVECPMQRIRLSKECVALADKLQLNEPGGFDERLISDPEDDCMRYLSAFPQRIEVPLFFVRLVKEDVVLGSAQFSGSQPFTEQHLHRMRGLEGPLCIAMGNILQHWILTEIHANILHDNQRLRRQLQGLDTVDVIGAGGGLKKVMLKVRQVAPVDVPVLITGETGTGKEVIAKALHELSPRRHKPFVAVNCGALPSSLIDSELFGYTRGAFTGATENRKGYFERAHGGTLFLDEIGELPLEAQSRLLRVLETREMDKVGGSAPVQLDIRLLTATNRNLRAMVDEGLFRNDLYFRLCVVSIDLPPLRQRKEDFPALVHYLLQRSAARFGMAVPSMAEGELERLQHYDWPGNIRELQNVLEEALVCIEGNTLRLTGAIPGCGASLSANGEDVVVLQDSAHAGENFPTHDDLLRHYFTRLLQSTGGRISGQRGAALKANLNAGTFRFKCVKLGVNLHSGE